MRPGYIERTLAGLLAASDYAAAAERTTGASGLLQRLDPRIKLVGLFGLIAVVIASHRLVAIGALFAVAVAFAALSGVRIARLAGWVWAPALVFTGSLALPAIFLTPGRVVVPMGYVSASEQGLRSAAFLISRAETAATLSALLVLTTPWPWVLKALRAVGCPVVLVTILGMTYRYIFVILRTAFDMFESRKSRTVGTLAPDARRRLAASAVGVLLSKSLQLSADVHLAMQSRGFRGEVHLLDDFRSGPTDWCWFAAVLAVAAAILWWGR